MKDTYCPKCRTHLILSDSIENLIFLKCPTCKSSIENPHYQKPKRKPIINIKEVSLSVDKYIGSIKTLGLIIISIGFAIIVFALSRSCDEGDEYCPDWELKVEDFGTFTKDDYDKVVEYSIHNETDLINEMIIDGRLVELPKGTVVYLIDSYLLGVAHVRIKNTTTQLWITTSSLKRLCK